MPNNTTILGTCFMIGFLLSLLGCSKSNDQPTKKSFIQEQSLEEIIASQTNMTPQTLSQLREYGVTESTELKLEFFFYTDQLQKAAALAEELAGMNYEVETGPSASDSEIQLITGWTTPMKMDETTVIDWTQAMCRVGWDHDCEFDGWGTNPKQ